MTRPMYQTQPPFWKTRRGQQQLVRGLSLIAIVIFAAVLLLPFFWLLSTSLKRPEEVYLQPPVWVPPAPQWSNYVDALRLVPLYQYALNTFTIVGFVLLGTVFSCSFSAYGFAATLFSCCCWQP